MIVINQQRLFLLLLLVFFSIRTISAQTKIWGVGSGTGVAEAEFSMPFIADTISGNFDSLAWTALTISNTDGVQPPVMPTIISPGAAYWERSLTGVSQGAYIGLQTSIASPSQLNGTALFDSDFMDNAGVADSFGTGLAPGGQIGDLISPRIDLTGYEDSAITVKFFCKWRAFEVNDFLVSMSIDDGLSWTDVDINSLLPCTKNELNEGWVFAPFYNITQGVTNLTHCRIRFRFDGYYYYAVLDDVSVQIADEYDIAIATANPADSSLAGAFEYIRVGNNRYMPYENIYYSDFTQWFWGMKVINRGSKNIVPSQNIRAQISIDFASASGGLVIPNVYRDTMNLSTDTLFANITNSVEAVESLRDLNFLINNGAGHYIVKYWVEHDGIDGNTTNDTILYIFTITEKYFTGSPSLSNVISKCRQNNGKPMVSDVVFPKGTEFESIQYGSMFYFPKGGNNCWGINGVDSVSFRYYVPSTYIGSGSQTLAVNIYEFTDGAGWPSPNVDGILDSNGSELTFLGIGLAQIPQVPANGTYGDFTVKNFLDPATGGPMAPFDDNSIYLITIWQNPNVLISGGPSTFNANTGLWFGADRVNYAINIAQTGPNAVIPHASVLNVVDSAGVGSWDWLGFSPKLVPSMAVHLNPVVCGSSTILQSEYVDLKIHPNPVQDLLNMEVSFDEATDVRYILTDVSGRVLNITYSKNVTNEVQTLDVSRLAPGVYFIAAKTGKGLTTKRFIKK